ncbi:uncharacterized protein LOC130622763 isoform X2 [Hydractinia symbiolongicarpus]|uniref:uncharacterized protein LOC130622763 isoform X2 n=1 Tax=Hydractinia symbiolongicarpus TaxID=13093 RepID=UPI00254C998A|nr:uncharacterized protein LOC130622763 isoform X2 [Hydractinia symbiolongicarpus]
MEVIFSADVYLRFILLLAYSAQDTMNTSFVRRIKRTPYEMSVSNQTTISTKLGFFNLRNLTVSLITLVFITLLYLTNQGSKYYTNNIVLPLYHPKMLIFHPNITPIINSSKTYTLPVNVPPQSCWKRSFQELLEPCKDSLSWTSRITDINLKTNLALSKIDTYFGPAGKTSFVKISTYDNMNRKKRRGGDSWWVTVTESISFHVVMFDNLDGSYTGWFDFVQPGTYDVRIDLKYSLCDGYRDPPVWWFKVGTDHGKYQKPGVLGGQKDFMHQSKKFTVTISGNKSIGDPNNIDNAYINDDCGYWIGGNNYVSKKRTFGPIKTHKRDGTIWFYGDSLQVRYENYFGGRPLCTQYFRCSVTYTWLYPNPHPSRKIYDNKDFDKNIPLNDIKAVLNNPVMKKNTSVLFVNWGLHVVLDLPFDVLKDFFQSFLTIVKELKQASPDAFPQIIWKSTTPTYEREYYDRNSGGSNAEADHIRFLTKQRVMLWNAYSRDEVEKSGIKIVNFFHIAASYPPGPLDGLHFAGEVFESTAVALEQYILSTV